MHFVLSAIMLISFIGTAHAAPNIEMMYVNGGCYRMGDTFGDGGKSERPVHEVCVSSFYIGKFLITQAQWVELIGSNPSSFIGDQRPVETVSWDDAQEFIIALNQLTGKKYRLPTEAEWEYAARSGGKKEKWAGTSDEKQLGDYAWYSGNSVEKDHVVGTRKPNGLGLYDMSGNLWEWCWDLYGDNYYKESPRDNPQGPAIGISRVIRGGSWSNSAGGVRATNRNQSTPSFHDSNSGFRLVLPAD